MKLISILFNCILNYIALVSCTSEKTEALLSPIYTGVLYIKGDPYLILPYIASKRVARYDLTSHPIDFMEYINSERRYTKCTIINKSAAAQDKSCETEVVIEYKRIGRIFDENNYEFRVENKDENSEDKTDMLEEKYKVLILGLVDRLGEDKIKDFNFEQWAEDPYVSIKESRGLKPFDINRLSCIRNLLEKSNTLQKLVEKGIGRNFSEFCRNCDDIIANKELTNNDHLYILCHLHYSLVSIGGFTGDELEHLFDEYLAFCGKIDHTFSLDKALYIKPSDKFNGQEMRLKTFDKVGNEIECKALKFMKHADSFVFKLKDLDAVKNEVYRLEFHTLLSYSTNKPELELNIETLLDSNKNVTSEEGNLPKSTNPSTSEHNKLAEPVASEDSVESKDPVETVESVASEDSVKSEHPVETVESVASEDPVESEHPIDYSFLDL